MSLRQVLVLSLFISAAPVASAGGIAETISISGFSYEPADVTIGKGETVDIDASGSHPLRLDDSAEVACTTNCNVTYLSVGTFGFYCNAHGGPDGVGMSGTVTVEDNPDIMFVGTFQFTLLL